MTEARMAAAGQGSGFQGFAPAAMTFLRGIAEHQNREWMAENRAMYETEIRVPFGVLISTLTDRFATLGLPLRGDPDRAQFRLNRDVRFSADKRPYKTHAGALLNRHGTKDRAGVLYIPIDPAGSFTAAGFYGPEPSVLERMRTGLVERPDVWADLIAALDRAGLALDRDGALRRTPRGFEAAAPALHDDLRLKSWVVRRGLAVAQIEAPDLVEDLVEFAHAALPLLNFGWACIDEM